MSSLQDKNSSQTLRTKNERSTAQQLSWPPVFLRSVLGNR